MLAKKQKFIYWLIGLGCGIVLSGMVMAFIGLSILKEEVSKSTNEVIKLEEDYIPETVEEVEKEGAKEEVAENKFKEPTYKWIQIPLSYGATQISTLLEEEGIIEDQEVFLNYVKEHNLTRKLICGSQYLPVGGEYDNILAVLTGELEHSN